LWVRLSVSELKHESALREVAVSAVTINDDDDLDALLSGGVLKEKEIAEITNMFLDNLDDVDAFAIDAFADDWLLDSQPPSKSKTPEIVEPNSLANELAADRDRIQKELEDLRSQHQFECEYVDQLEQEIISVSNDRDRQVTELTTQLQQLQNQLQSQVAKLQSHPPVTDDRDLSDRLAIHVLQLEEEFQHRLAIALEIETQKVAQKYTQEINSKNELIYQLQYQNTELDISQQTLTAELESTQVFLKESTKTLELAETKLSEVSTQRDQLEEELIQHLSNRAQLQQSLRGLENEYVTDLTRVQELEQQIEELQNQVLHQASKASEYEAAIQHWKEQSVRHQHHALQLSGALERLLVERPVRHLTEPMQYESTYDQGYRLERSLESVTEPTPVRSFRPNSKVDLPAFLVRHR
jgi:chromosome segregation ATPase